MEVVLLLLFIVGVYSFIGYVSMSSFHSWCDLLFDQNREVARAAGTIAAVFWPIGWPAIVVVGLYHAGLMIVAECWNALKVVINSFKVVFNHFKESERGEQ